jgi:hypothetical protein
MANRLSTSLALFFLFGNAASASTHSVQLSWEDLRGVIGAKEVAISSPTGAIYKGRVHRVEDDAIVLEGRNPSAKRTQSTEIRFTEFAGNGRHFGRRVGGALGLVAGLVGAAAIGLSEGSGSNTGEKTAAAALAVGGLPLGLLVGDYLAKQADKQVTIIHVVPLAPVPPKG